MTSPRVPGLLRLPYELVACVVENLSVEDVFNWSLCSRHFQYMVREDRFCKPVLMTKVPGSLEAREALDTGRFSRELRRLVKRHSALSRASPYFVGNIACADSYGLFEGKLCYIIEERPARWLRILDIRNSTAWELVVDIPSLISSAIPQAAHSRKYKFRVLYQAAGIISCLFSFVSSRTENWLLIIKPQTHQILEIFRLESTARIFVRNNNKFLYFGTHSWEGADGYKKWVIKGFDLVNLAWLPYPRMYLSDLAGYDIGSTACFEIFGDYFYGLSNQHLFEADDPEWTSHYYCFRFPLHEPSIDKIQVMKKGDSWRRKHSEGPIDDRWGFLSLETDETTQKPVILECRKEWLKARSGSQRTYYTTEIVFCEQTTPEQSRVRDTTRRRMGDHPQCNTFIPSRRPQYVHAGDDSTSITSLLVRSKTFFCTYVRCCHTFIDLIDDTSVDTPSPQRIRLRTGYRRLKPGIELMSGELAQHSPPTASDGSRQPEMQPYQDNTIFIWPPDRAALGPNSQLDSIERLLNVDGHQGCVTATADERSVIYATSDGPKGLKILVLLSFDPAVRFDGTEYGGNIAGQQISQNTREEEKGHQSRMMQHHADVSMGVMDGIQYNASSTGHSPPFLPQASEGCGPWASYERAMHFDMQRKLCFGQ